MDSHSRRIGGGSADLRRRLRNRKPVAAAVRRRTTDSISGPKNRRAASPASPCAMGGCPCRADWASIRRFPSVASDGKAPRSYRARRSERPGNCAERAENKNRVSRRESSLRTLPQHLCSSESHPTSAIRVSRPAGSPASSLRTPRTSTSTNAAGAIHRPQTKPPLPFVDSWLFHPSPAFPRPVGKARAPAPDSARSCACWLSAHRCFQSPLGPGRRWPASASGSQRLVGSALSWRDYRVRRGICQIPCGGLPRLHGKANGGRCRIRTCDHLRVREMR